MSVATDGVVVTFLKKEPMPPFLPLAISRGCAERGVVDGMPSWSSFYALRPPITLIGGRSDHSDLNLSDPQSLNLLILGAPELGHQKRSPLLRGGGWFGPGNL